MLMLAQYFKFVSNLKFHMGEIIQQENPVWYIDATGSILKGRPSKSQILLYSIVCYDRTRENLIQVAEFFLGMC